MKDVLHFLTKAETELPNRVPESTTRERGKICRRTRMDYNSICNIFIKKKKRKTLFD